jgi:hypothetical protein
MPTRLLIRKSRLIVGLNFLDEVSENLCRNVLLIKAKVVSGTTFEDAEILAGYAGLARGTNGLRLTGDGAGGNVGERGASVVPFAVRIRRTCVGAACG